MTLRDKSEKPLSLLEVNSQMIRNDQTKGARGFLSTPGLLSAAVTRAHEASLYSYGVPREHLKSYVSCQEHHRACSHSLQPLSPETLSHHLIQSHQIKALLGLQSLLLPLGARPLLTCPFGQEPSTPQHFVSPSL